MNQTFSQYAELGAEHLALMRDGRIDSSGFDILLHRLITEDGLHRRQRRFDFRSALSYIVENNALERLSDAGRHGQTSDSPTKTTPNQVVTVLSNG